MQRSATVADEPLEALGNGKAQPGAAHGGRSASARKGPGRRSVLGVRNRRERALQTLSYEAGGLLIVTPAYAWWTDHGGAESLAMLVTISLMMMTWAALYNTAFDLIEHQVSGRVASDRPEGLRVMHTVLLEASAVLATWPVIAAFTGYDWLHALSVDLSLTLAYMVYGYFFHRAYDRLRPVRPGVEAGEPAG